MNFLEEFPIFSQSTVSTPGNISQASSNGANEKYLWLSNLLSLKMSQVIAGSWD